MELFLKRITQVCVEKISIKVLSYLLEIKKPLQNTTALISKSGIIRDTAIPYGT